MKTISLPRRGGKSTQLMEWVISTLADFPDHEVVVLCHDEQWASTLRRGFRDLPDVHFFSMRSSYAMWVGRRVKVAIDNADLISARDMDALSMWWPTVDLVTLTGGPR